LLVFSSSSFSVSLHLANVCAFTFPSYQCVHGPNSLNLFNIINEFFRSFSFSVGVLFFSLKLLERHQLFAMLSVEALEKSRTSRVNAIFTEIEAQGVHNFSCSEGLYHASIISIF